MRATCQIPRSCQGYQHILCLTEETFTFLENVLTEVMELSPSKYIHIGAMKLASALERISFLPGADQGKRMKDEHELQSYLYNALKNS